MVKATDFWKFICEKLNYRFFAGVACKGFDRLYRKMNPEFMHYIPAVTEQAAIGLAMGASITSFKSAALIHENGIFDLIKIYNQFILKNPLSFMIFMYTENEFCKKLLRTQKIPFIVLSEDFKKELIRFDKRIIKNQQCGIVLVGKDVIV